jgi:hypothetical protein
MKKSCCPEMSRDANGYNRHSRNKALHNAAFRITGISHPELKLYEGLLIADIFQELQHGCTPEFF